ncbi:MAG: cysteine hydrolase family protein [Parvimonas micra]|uniref:Cysteine hydrolase n=1 Tax=Parvimonas micra TaxID=33033 RepID=A0AAX3K6J2_9FIRM|nr:isochorismatase family cysteine hydrolase [Parvimonas micra]AXU09910.1 cysteine hydrolase [Parvimonas micra]MBF1275730.1 cysteine hydrolase [Parvimonas micra]MCZ7409386.1 cysteine hydrolase [Parvimonas micra]WBB30655.1 cysteine hydrolase [Parvimonas micra]WBB32185.1 cysteine hydrolase [Parvimonas micra]
MKILVVIDVQNDFVDGKLGTQEAINMIPKLKEKIKNFDGEIIYTMDTHDDNYLNTQEGRKLPIKHCIKGTDAWKIREGIYKENCKIFEKAGFGSSDLVEYLKSINEKEKIESIEFVGICTDICVIVNTLMIKGFLPEVELIVDSKCCAGVTPQSHNTALEAMKMCQVDIL